MCDDADDAPWLTYHALIVWHDVPDGDFLRTCMEDIEHIFIQLCSVVKNQVPEELERVIKVAVFCWTCALFSVRRMRHYR